MRLTAIALAFLLIPAQADAALADQDLGAMTDAAITGYLQPRYASVAAQAEELEVRVDALCGRPADETLKGARLAFGALVDAWSRVEFVRIGPAAEEHRAERFNFFPDERGIGLRQVQQILAHKDATAAALVTLKDKSVAVQGLGALEFVLFGSGYEALVEKKEPFRCAYGHAIATNLHDIASSLVAGWKDDGVAAERLRRPGAENPLYKNDAEALGDIIEIMSTGFAIVRDLKIEPLVGTSTKKATPRRAVFRRSGLTLAAIRANIEGLYSLYRAMGVAAVLGRDDETSWIDTNMRFEVEQALSSLDAVTLPLDQALNDEAQRGKLVYLRVVMKTLWQHSARDMTVALGLRTGFNALDGD